MEGEVAVLVPAAGAGSRMGGALKQFRTLGGKSVLAQTLLAFERHPDVNHIVVAATDPENTLGSELLRQAVSKLTAIVPGGATRQDSVASALRFVPESARLILVHDAVRPFVLAGDIRRVIDVARAKGAASLAIPVADTLRRGAGGLLSDTISREGLFRMLTPQGARRDWLEAAYGQCESRTDPATDDVELLQRSGYPVAIVEGGNYNLKITTQSDWEWAQGFWPFWEKIRDQTV